MIRLSAKNPVSNRIFALAILLIPAAVILLSASTYQSNFIERIERIENGLQPAFLVNGRDSRMKIADRLAFYKVPGVSIAVINGSRIEWSKSYGRREAGRDDPVSVETLFQAASISKPVAAMGALYLVERKKLDLDEDVNRKLRSWQVPPSEFLKDSRVTLRGLVSHSAGVTVHGFRGYAADENVPDLKTVLDGSKPANSDPIRVDLIPGTRWRYSGGGYTIMQQLMIDVTGREFPVFMHDNVLRKLDMRNSTYQQPLPVSLRSRAAIGHRANGEPIKGAWHTYPEMAAAGLWTTPNDLAKFAVSIINGVNGKKNGVLSPAMTRQMISKAFGQYGLGLGLTFGPDGRTLSFGHGGANEGFRCNMVAFPESGKGAVVMTNGDRGGALASEILRAIAVEYDWPERKPVTRNTVSVAPAILNKYVGKYDLQPGVVIEFKVVGGRLWVSVAGQLPAELLAESESKFFSATGEVPDIRFSLDERTGEPEMIVDLGGDERKLKRRQ
ncbi:MAG: serine hydrolase [Blastocatellales bacterium]